MNGRSYTTLGRACDKAPGETGTRSWNQDSCLLAHTRFPICMSPRLQPQFLPPVPAASPCFLHSHFRAENPATVSHALRVKSNILPITYKPSMTCSLHPHLSHYFIQPLFSSPMGLFSVPPRSIWSTHLRVLETGVSASLSPP